MKYSVDVCSLLVNKRCSALNTARSMFMQAQHDRSSSSSSRLFSFTPCPAFRPLSLSLSLSLSKHISARQLNLISIDGLLSVFFFKTISELNTSSSFSFHCRSTTSSSSPTPSHLHPLNPTENLLTHLTTTPFKGFCSGHLNLDEAQVPAPIDYRSVFEEDENHKLADSTIEDLQEKFEEYGDHVQIDGLDIDYGNQVLTLKLGNLGTYVLNKQTPNRQIWLSSPVSGPLRFDWDRSTKSWVYRRTKANLLQLFEGEFKRLCGTPISLS